MFSSFLNKYFQRPFLLIITITLGLSLSGPVLSGSAAEVWGKNYFPNVELTNHLGEKVRFFDDVIKDKVVALNFIYTSCTEVCPTETARMKNVAGILGERMGKDVFFYSISIDPKNDTPKILNDYRKKFGIGQGWEFLTGKEEDILLLRKKLGLYITGIQDRTLSDHNINLVIGNQALGRWVKRSPFENPYVLANQLGSWLHNWKQVRTQRNKYEDAPGLRQISSGEMKFRNMCTSCHVINGGLAKLPNMQQIGPDLFNVVQSRDRKWLERWLAEPDKMLKEKDPLATALLKQYKVAMPNLSLSAPDIAALIQYMDEETKRLQKVAGKTTAHTHESHGTTNKHN
ncbi:MAG: SCO family protein [Gammaproteobacteria bacterium]|nr:SCO family protein [Gammaproteobacteria bacterium]